MDHRLARDQREHWQRTSGLSDHSPPASGREGPPPHGLSPSLRPGRHGGFAVHFFPRELVESLAEGRRLDEVHPFEEGELPRRLWRVTQHPS